MVRKFRYEPMKRIFCMYWRGTADLGETETFLPGLALQPPQSAAECRQKGSLLIVQQRSDQGLVKE